MVSMAGSKGGISEMTKETLVALRKVKIEKIMQPVSPVEEQLPDQTMKEAAITESRQFNRVG